MRKLQLLSIALAALIMTLPIVSAQQLTLVRYGGENSASGYANVRDKLKVDVKASLPQENIIDREQVRFFVDDSYVFFDSCVKDTQSEYTTCTLSEDEFQAYESIPFTIKLFNDDGNEVLSKTATLSVDSVVPTVSVLEVNPKRTGGTVEVAYKAEDFGLSFGDTENCAGVKSVKIMQNGNTLLSETGSVGTCVKENVVRVTLTESGKVCAVAEDFTGKEGLPVCSETITFDNSAPNIASLSITDLNGIEITHVKPGQEIVGTATVTVLDDTRLNVIEANFEKLSSVTGFVSPNVKSAPTYAWQIPVKETNLCKVNVKATDELGNSATHEFDCSIKPDSTAPTVINLMTTTQRNNTNVYGYSDVITVGIEDRDDKGGLGAGLDRRLVYADLRELGLGVAVQADSCELSGNIWRCSWRIIPGQIAETKYAIKITANDDLENSGETKTFDIIYDGSPPNLPLVVSQRVIRSETGEIFAKGALIGDFVEYTVETSGFIKAEADFSELGGSRKLAKYCEGLDGEPADCQLQSCNCVFENEVLLSGPYDATVPFYFTDDANNVVNVSAVTEVYGIDNETNPKYWKAEVICFPELIDRTTASKINPYVSCKVHLNPANQKVKNIDTLAIVGPSSPSECTGPVDLNVNDVFITNNYEGSKDPYINFKLEARDYYINSLNITCPISVISKRVVNSSSGLQVFVTREAQVLNASISLSFYNEPMKDMYANIDSQIEKAMKDSFATQEWLGQLRKFMHYGEILCQIKTLITSFISIFYTTAAVLGFNKDAICASPAAPFGCAQMTGSFLSACHTTETMSGWFGEGVLQIIDPICGMLNCYPSQGGKQEWNVQSLGGGNVPWCSKIEEMMQLVPGIGMAAEQSGTRAINIKDSLLWSTVCLCIPGIINNLEKYRQLQCFKSVCLYDNVKNEGYPPSYCNEMEGYLQCQFITGQLFASIPFSQLLEKLTDLFFKVLTDPVAMFTVGIGAVCQGACLAAGAAPSALYTGCALVKTASTLGESIASMVAMTKTKGYFKNQLGNQYCSRMEKIEKEMEEVEGEA